MCSISAHPANDNPLISSFCDVQKGLHGLLSRAERGIPFGCLLCHGICFAVVLFYPRKSCSALSANTETSYVSRRLNHKHVRSGSRLSSVHHVQATPRQAAIVSELRTFVLCCRSEASFIASKLEGLSDNTLCHRADMVWLQRRSGMALKPKRSSFDAWGGGGSAFDTSTMWVNRPIPPPLVVEDVLPRLRGPVGEAQTQPARYGCCSL